MIDLKFDSVSKRYRVGQAEAEKSNGSSLFGRLKSLRIRPEEFWAVRNISFEVPTGQALGIIGHNGAGKSTVLKMLAGITAPTSGEIMINGRLTALIEVGSGLHPELTGRENVYLSGSIRGMKRREITEKFESIIHFAGIRRFIDMPIKRYSSGMKVRLGFAIAAHLESDILLLDEVLAVGDANFRSKCYKRIDDLKAEGQTIVFISHDLKSVERVCQRVLLMQRGEVIADGEPDEVIKEYMKEGVNRHSASALTVSAGQLVKARPRAEVTGLTVFDAEDRETTTLYTGRPFRVCLKYRAETRLEDVSFTLFFSAHDNKVISYLSTLDRDEQLDVGPGSGAVEFTCQALGLMPGTYYIGTIFKQRKSSSSEIYEHNPTKLMVQVEGDMDVIQGDFYMPHRWQ